MAPSSGGAWYSAMMTWGFSIAKPLAKLAAEELETVEVEAWSFESETPPLEAPPVLSRSAEMSHVCLLNRVPSETTPFSPILRDTISDSTDSPISQFIDVISAAHAYISRWRATRIPTTMTTSGTEKFEFIAPPELAQCAHDRPYYGVQPNGPSLPIRCRKEAYANVSDNPERTASDFWGDALRGCCSYSRRLRSYTPQT